MTTTQIIIIAAIVSFIVAVAVSTIAMLTLQHAPLESEDNQPKFKDLGMVVGKYEYDAWNFKTMAEVIDHANEKSKKGWRIIDVRKLKNDGISPYEYVVIFEREIG